jgi:glycosyltransferase involved in cell wall biosynthesis
MARWHAMNWSRYHSLSYALADLGHEVFVLQPPPLDVAETNFQDIVTQGHPNIHIRDVRIWSWLWRCHFPLDKIFRRAIVAFAAYMTTKKLLREQEIDLLLIYSIPLYPFSSLKGVCVIFDFADDYVDMLAFELGKFNNSFARRLANWMLATMMRRSALTLTVSNVLARQAIGNVHVLPNGVSLEKATSIPLTPIQTVANDGKPVVGFLGAFEYFIDLDLIIDVAKAMPDLHFLLVGTGREFKRVKHRVESDAIRNLQLIGGVPHDQVFSYIRAMDVCLNIFAKLPVSHRACPIKLFEYLSQQKPVISTRLDELSYIDDGFLWYGDTVDEIVFAVRDILAGGSDVDARVKRGFQITRQSYTWDRIAASFVELAKPLIKND